MPSHGWWLTEGTHFIFISRKPSVSSEATRQTALQPGLSSGFHFLNATFAEQLCKTRKTATVSQVSYFNKKTNVLNVKYLFRD